MHIMGRHYRREGVLPRKHRLAAAACVLALAAGLSVTGSGAALAANNDRIDVGFTILQNGLWKGSGSFSNGGGTYTSVCARFWVDDGIRGVLELSVRCVNTPKGSGYAFSVPSVACSYPPFYPIVKGTVFTTIQGYSGKRLVDEKWSNSIPETC